MAIGVLEPTPLAAEVHPKSYSDFTLEIVGRNLGIRTEEADLLPQLVPVEAPAWLNDLLARRTQLATISEKARSEFIVAPILVASRDLCPLSLAIFSGQRLDVDPSRGLMGECDFLLSIGPPVPPLRAPIIAIAEAKKNDIEAGLGQCVAQMVAATKFNSAESGTSPHVFGCVTTGEVWQFLKLADDIALIDRKRYFLDDLDGILGAIQAIIREGSGGVGVN
jgi:hypothetical protein